MRLAGGRAQLAAFAQDVHDAHLGPQRAQPQVHIVEPEPQMQRKAYISRQESQECNHEPVVDGPIVSMTADSWHGDGWEGVVVLTTQPDTVAHPVAGHGGLQRLILEMLAVGGIEMEHPHLGNDPDPVNLAALTPTGRLVHTAYQSILEKNDKHPSLEEAWHPAMGPQAVADTTVVAITGDVINEIMQDDEAFCLYPYPALPLIITL